MDSYVDRIWEQLRLAWARRDFERVLILEKELLRIARKLA